MTAQKSVLLIARALLGLFVAAACCRAGGELAAATMEKPAARAT